MSEQMNIFECLYPNFKPKKKIRLIELFAGYGSQALAMEYLNVDFEHWKICEWNYKSFQAYKDIHFPYDNTDYSAGLSKEQLIEYLAERNISSNWNEPMKAEQIKRLNESKLREIYNNIQSTHNLVDVSQVHANDLEIINKDQYTYILTYSFPCQDLSLAGLRAGMNADSNTRSSMLWQVGRILEECKEQNCLPDVLLMENVPQVHGADNMDNFKKWLLTLERYGYQSYWQDLIATDYGIPQIRNRTFCISLLGDYNYTFPKPIQLTKRLKDLLEDKVADKYYLSKQLIDFFTYNSALQKEKGNGFKFEIQNGEKPSKSITTKAGCRMDDNFIDETNIEHYEIKPAHGYFPGSIKKADSISTIDACIDYQHIVLGEKLRIKNATEQGYLEAEPGDCVDISSRMAAHRGTVQKDKAQTLTTLPDRGGMVKETKMMTDNKPKLLGNIYGEQFGTGFAGNVWDSEKTCPALMTMAGGNRQPLITQSDKGIVINPLKGESGKSWQFEQQVYDENGSTRTLKASDGSGNIPKVVNQLRIRKLTPKECFRLMGVKDAEFEKVQQHQSDSTLYHLAGDSIVTTCLMAIFGELLNVDWKEKIREVYPGGNES